MILETVQNFVIVLLFGGLILQSFLVISNPMKANGKANLFFGLFLLHWSSFWLLDILRITGFIIPAILPSIIFAFQIFTPIYLFFSTVFFINPNYIFKKIDLLCLIVPCIYIPLLFYKPDNQSATAIIDFIAIFHNLPYIAIIYFRIKKYQKRIETISSFKESIDLKWLENLTLKLFGIIIITVGYELFNAFVYKLNQHVIMDVLFLYIVYSISYQVLRQKEIYPVNEKHRKELLLVDDVEVEKADKKKLISDDEFEDFKIKLLNIMDGKKPFLDGELNLSKLAEFMNLNAHQLSYLLNNGFNKNFFQFINSYRVEYAKNLLKNMENQKFSMLGIAFESGFNSKTSFNTIFKKITGETPSEYRKKCQNL